MSPKSSPDRELIPNIVIDELDASLRAIEADLRTIRFQNRVAVSALQKLASEGSQAAIEALLTIQRLGGEHEKVETMVDPAAVFCERRDIDSLRDIRVRSLQGEFYGGDPFVRGSQVRDAEMTNERP